MYLMSEIVTQPSQQIKTGDSTTFVFFQQHPVLFGHTAINRIHCQTESPMGRKHIFNSQCGMKTESGSIVERIMIKENADAQS